MAAKIARVRWEMGQALLPDHFVALEEALVTDTVVRSRMTGLPGYGIAALKINETLLAEGIFSVAALSAVMPSGLLLDVPGNVAVSPFNLNVTGSVRVPVYAHVIEDGASSDNAEENRAEAEGEIARIVHRIVLSSEQSFPDALETMKLARFEKDPDGVWNFSSSFIPPLLQVGTSPFLKAELLELSQLLEPFQYKLSQEIAASYLSGDSLAAAKQCLKSVYQMQRFLANLSGRVHVHPYHVHEALKNFYTEVCFYKNSMPEYVTEPYDCDHLAACFGRTIDPLKEQLQLAQAPSPYLPFELRDNMWRITLPSRVRAAREVYFLVQKKNAAQPVSLEEIKLAAVSRVPLIHKLALQGLSVQKIDRPPFQHSFGSEVDFYLVVQGEEWDHALRELALGFYQIARFEGIKFYLYWRFV